MMVKSKKGMPLKDIWGLNNVFGQFDKFVDYYIY